MIITKRVNISSLFFSFPNTEAGPRSDQRDWWKPFSFLPLFALFIFRHCQVRSHCISISPEDSTFLSNKKRNNFFTWIVKLRFLSVLDINHMLQVFKDCLTVIFSSALSLFHDSFLCKAGERIRYIYMMVKRGENLVCAFHIFRTTEHRDGSHSGQ